MSSLFPLTEALLKETLGKQGEMLWLEASEMPSHQVPMFIKSKGLSMEICELAYYEAIQNYLKNQKDFGKLKAHPAGYSLSPEVQWMNIQSASRRLSKAPGLYVFWVQAGRIHEMILSEKQARILDKLLDDMVPSFDVDEKKELDYFKKVGVVQ